MRCYFLRHGIAVDAGDWRGGDFDRPLTGEGVEKIEREARTIAGLDLQLDAIVTSPLVRARQTAESVATELKLRDRLIDSELLGLDFDLERLANVLAEHPGANAILFVGHEPGLSRTIGRLVGGARVEMKKGSLACVGMPDASALDGKLLFLLPPKVLASRARGRAGTPRS